MTKTNTPCVDFFRQRVRSSGLQGTCRFEKRRTEQRRENIPVKTCGGGHHAAQEDKRGATCSLYVFELFLFSFFWSSALGFFVVIFLFSCFCLCFTLLFDSVNSLSFHVICSYVHTYIPLAFFVWCRLRILFFNLKIRQL